MNSKSNVALNKYLKILMYSKLMLESQNYLS